ncbi:MAG: alternative ribosome rescue aminoacyl-tRNA hydrolase ArfB [Gemmatimonadota bacterium]
MSRIRINRRLSIPRSELEFRTSRSGGPGGQHANTTASRVQLRWNVEASRSLSDRRRQRIRSRLANRIDGNGVLQITVDTHRSQHRNRKEAVDRFAELVREALRPGKKRKKTRRTRSSNERRLRKKKKRGRKKELRRKIRPPKDD